MTSHSTDLRLSFSDIANMTLLGEESFYRCEVIDAEFAAKDAEIARLRGVFSKIIGLSDLEMRDGDTARELAQSVLETSADTGHAEADRIIGRLASSDPDFDDCTDAVVLIRRLVADLKGPDGHATWRDAAVAERLLRVEAEKRAAETTRESLKPELLVLVMDWILNDEGWKPTDPDGFWNGKFEKLARAAQAEWDALEKGTGRAPEAPRITRGGCWFGGDYGWCELDDGHDGSHQITKRALKTSTRTTRAPEVCGCPYGNCTCNDGSAQNEEAKHAK